MREARRAVALVWKSAPGLTLLNAGLTTVVSLLPLLGLILLRRLLDQIILSPQTQEVLWTVALMAAVALGTAALRSISAFVSEQQALEVSDYMKTLLHSKSIEMDLEFYENSQYQDTLRRAQQEAPFRPVRIVNSLLQVAQSGLSVLAIGGFLMFTLHWAFFLVLLLAAAPGVWIRIRQARENFELQHSQTATERSVSYMDLTLTHDWFAKELRLFDLGDFFSRRSQELRARLRGERIQLAKRRCTRETVTHLFTTGALYGSLAWIALRASRNTISIGSLVMYFQAIQRGLGSLQEFLTGLSNLYENNLFLRNLSEFLDLNPRVTDPPHAKKVPAICEGLSFENVSFVYPGKQELTLKEISFSVRSGQKVALVGENGSGKTTLVKLMCRLYDPTNGRITLDGVDIREFAVADLRRQFSVIFQDFVRYHLSLAQNISLGDLQSGDDRTKIIESARKSGADELAARFSEGYDTKLGRVYYEGEELSGGEWQKVALARAFLREAPFIIMDEPSSALDARAEYELFERFAKMAEGRAALLISHRLSTVRMADTILMMEHGRIVEQGGHDALMARNGPYARLFEMQAKNYR